jgi:hypothetical protein
MKKILFILLFSFLFMSCKLIFWHETKPEIVGYKKVSLGIVNINSTILIFIKKKYIKTLDI